MAAPPVSPPAQPLLGPLPPELWPNTDHIVTEDGAPVDGLFSEKQMRLLTRPLYSSWPGPGPGRPFVAFANVGLFYAVREPPLVPDTMLSLDVRLTDNPLLKRYSAYFMWEYGKFPEAVIEIVSNKEGGELDVKLQKYAQIGILYYVVFDPDHLIQEEDLRIFVLRDRIYEPLVGSWLPGVGLGLTLWRGAFEGWENLWLRWCDRDGRLIPTGEERAEQERQRAERLAARLRELGVDPDEGR